MNVAFDPWIPVVTQSGERKLAGLFEVLTEGAILADLAVRPHERVSLMRLLLCVAHAALNGPKDYEEWKEVPERLPEAARKYLEEWKDSFELFHKKKPWLQVAAISESRSSEKKEKDLGHWIPVSKLNFSFASGNNSTLFDHGGVDDNRRIPIEETAVSMLTFQCFSVGGLMGQVFWNGERCGSLANAKKVNGPVKSSDAPCVPSSMVHALLRGSTLFETIHLNLLTFDDICRHYGKQSIGKPVWEKMPVSFSDSKNIQNATETFLGRLVPMTRVIKLHSSGSRMLLGDGFSYRSFADGFPPEPTATVLRKDGDGKEERVLLSYQSPKALWRQLGAIMVKRKAGELGGPLPLQSIRDAERSDLVACALARKKATIVDTSESVFHISRKLRSAEGTSTYDREVKHAENLESKLGWAVETYRQEIDHGWEGRLKSAGASKGELKAKLRSTANSYYWTAVEKNLSMLFAHIEAIETQDAIPTRDAWRKMLFKNALDAYQTACGQETPRQMRAFAKGRKRLTTFKEEPSGNTNQEEKEVA